MTEDEKLKADYFFREAERVGGIIVNYYLSAGRTIPIGFTIIALAASISSMKQELITTSILFPVISIASFAVMLYGVLMFVEVVSQGGYKKFLEERFNDMLKENLLLWESRLSVRTRLDPIIPVIYAIYALIVVLLSAYGLYLA